VPAGAHGATVPGPTGLESAPAPEPAVPPASAPAASLATEPAPVAGNRPATGAVLAGAAAAVIVLFGRKLRRA
jgi:hypothetical protein